MFQYEYEKRPPSAETCSSRATMTSDWGRVYPNSNRTYTAERARRPLPPRPVVCERMPTKTTVPLKVWIIASASCFAVCAALVLATVVITKWGTTEVYSRELFDETPEPIYSKPYQKPTKQHTTEDPEPITDPETTEEDNNLEMPILEKLSIFKNIVANREKKRNEQMDLGLIAKPQIHPLHDALHHKERKIEKKDHPKLPLHFNEEDDLLTMINKEISEGNLNNNDKRHLNINIEGVNKNKHDIPDFKPTLPDMLKLVKDNSYKNLKRHEIDYEEYYNDDNLYDDYMQSNTMTSYLIEKIQELHDWINTDPDLKPVNVTRKATSTDFNQLLKALNDSLVEGNVTIIMSKLKDIYFGENFTMTNHSRKVILSNSTNLLSFGILTLDIMLLHNIQLMAWENQEAARIKMMKDPEVFAFNALFLEPSKVTAKFNEVNDHESPPNTKRQNLRHEFEDYYDFGKNLLENVLEIGMSTARAAIHLGRAYKNTKIILTQLSNKEALNANIQLQMSKNSNDNSLALQHLQSSFNGSVNSGGEVYTELDCVWLLYCRNLIATSALSPPYGTMARINGMALRMLTGEMSPDKALDTMLYEVFTGWTELRCNDMFPRCSKANPASIVMDTILQPLRKSQTGNRI